MDDRTPLTPMQICKNMRGRLWTLFFYVLIMFFSESIPWETLYLFDPGLSLKYFLDMLALSFSIHLLFDVHRLLKVLRSADPDTDAPAK